MVHPKPSAIHEIGFERLSRCASSPGQGSGYQRLDIAAVDPDAKAILGSITENVGKGERSLILTQKNVPVGFIGVTETVLQIVDGDGLPALHESGHEVAKSLVIKV